MTTNFLTHSKNSHEKHKPRQRVGLDRFLMKIEIILLTSNFKGHVKFDKEEGSLSRLV